jgi:flagellar basal body-associated protein FliL
MRSFSALPAFLIPLLLASAPALADDGQKAPAHKETQSESYMMIEPMYATVFDAGRPSGMLMVAIGLDIPNAKLRNDATRAMPLLRDDYLRNLMNFTSAVVHPWEQPDVTEIVTRLQHVTDRALHKTGAKVLIAEMSMRVTK